MAAERIIGVDFGTSTSVIRVKRYQDGKPVGDPLETKPVTFKMGSTMVPTLIQKLPSGDAYFGYEAEISRRNTETFRNFKVDIENPDEGIRRQARELTKEYFTYLAKSYRTQSEGGHLGESDDEEHTIISYPVKWSNETKVFMVRTAKDAGFPHVEGIDEARAAIQAVTDQNANLLTRKGYFRDGVPVNILLIDMGAGTTDLVLCRHSPGAQPKTDILNIWPQGGNALFGGWEVDELLKNYICQAMPEKDADAVLRKVGLEKYKAWKEGMVSPALEKRETVDSFAALDDLLDVLESDAEYSIDRDSFETHAANYLRQFPALVNGCVSTAGLSGDDIDLVILTGGHSQWYFVREMLSGKLDRFGKIGLRKIQTDPERVIPITLPQETVALGLAYRPTPIVSERTAGVDNPVRENVFPLKYDPYSRIRPVIAAGPNHMVALRKNGTVFAIGTNDYSQCNVNSWQGVVAVTVGAFHTVGLKKDGTVIAVGQNNHDQCNVSNWRDIVAISAGVFHSVGLKTDGTVIAVGYNKNGQCNVSDWRDIVAITAGPGYTVGLKKDGTAITTASKLNVSDWRDILAIAAGLSHTIGLKKDGTVIAVGNNKYGQCNVSRWRDVVAIAAGIGIGYDHTVGLRKEGTVIAVGNNDYDQCNVGSWRDVVAIAAGYKYTVGLKKDGTLVGVGDAPLSYNIKKEDGQEAARWFARDAEQSDPRALELLGECYEKGHGVDRDIQKAAEYYQLAHKGGSASGTCSLGLCYELGRGVPEDKAKAAELYRQAAEQNYARAQCNLGYCYYQGIGVKEDDGQAFYWFQKAAEQDYPRALFLLGECYEKGCGVDKDVQKAVEYYQLAHKGGYAAGTCSLGLCYELGRGVPEDKLKAAQYYRQAADGGNVTAMCNLGYCYYTGIGVKEDNAEAVRWFQEAASRGQPRALFLLGECYEKGYGVSADLVQAREYYQKAADKDYKSAEEALRRMGGDKQRSGIDGLFGFFKKQ